MNNETQKVDVLAVMDDHITALEYDVRVGEVAQDTLDEMREARAAVAELIEAARIIDSNAIGTLAWIDGREKLRAALARVGGAS